MQVAAMVHGILQAYAPGCPVEKASYDDFYLDVTSLCQMHGVAESSPPNNLHITNGGTWDNVSNDMRIALQVSNCASTWKCCEPAALWGSVLSVLLPRSLHDS